MSRYSAAAWVAILVAVPALAGTALPAAAQEAASAQEASTTGSGESHEHGAHGHDEAHEHGESHGHDASHEHGEAHGHDESAGHGEAATGEDLHAAGFHHDFGDADRWSKIFDSPERVAWQKPDEVVRLMGVAPGMRVADIGAGTGFFLGPLASAVGPQGRVLGLDVSSELVAHMRDRAEAAGWRNVEIGLVEPDDPGFAPASVDRILIVNTWHHIDARPAYTRKLAQGLRPGGAIILVDYTLESEDGPPKAHRLAPERVVRELEAGGLVAEVVEEDLPRQYVVIARPQD